jgi:hypothetical protein
MHVKLQVLSGWICSYQAKLDKPHSLQVPSTGKGAILLFNMALALYSGHRMWFPSPTAALDMLDSDEVTGSGPRAYHKRYQTCPFFARRLSHGCPSTKRPARGFVEPLLNSPPTETSTTNLHFDVSGSVSFSRFREAPRSIGDLILIKQSRNRDGDRPGCGL